MGGKRFERLTESFTLEGGAARLSPVFQIRDRFVHDSELRTADLEAYLADFHSTRDMFEPPPTDEEWAQAVAALREEVGLEIARDGQTVDAIRRGFFVCSRGELTA
jgi:hypothetical protein